MADRTLLVTGGTVFVSRFVAEYFARRGDTVYILNRGSRPQPQHLNIHPILADRHSLGDTLKGYTFDAVLDVTAYTAADVQALVTALDSVKDYLFVSSSAVYPETLPQPFAENAPCGPNIHWGAYGTNKLAAEQWLADRLPQSYILRPPYLYGPMENLYRAPFVFDCADENRPFCLPGDGQLKLQLFHVEDLCRFIEILLEQHPAQRIFNVGNPQPVTVTQWVNACYQAAHAQPGYLLVDSAAHEQWRYFPFRDYEYLLDVTAQTKLMPQTKPLHEGLAEEYAWYAAHPDEVRRKPYLEYIDREILSAYLGAVEEDL